MSTNMECTHDRYLMCVYVLPRAITESNCRELLPRAIAESYCRVLCVLAREKLT